MYISHGIKRKGQIVFIKGKTNRGNRYETWI